jgi:hypothetical protein
MQCEKMNAKNEQRYTKRTTCPPTMKLMSQSLMTIAMTTEDKLKVYLAFCSATGKMTTDVTIAIAEQENGPESQPIRT